MRLRSVPLWLALLLLAATPAFAQGPSWPAVLDDASPNSPLDVEGATVKAVATSTFGHVLATGTFRGTATFGACGSLVSGGSTDIFVARYDEAGRCIWAERAGGTGPDDATDIAADSAGNGYVVGTYSNEQRPIFPPLAAIDTPATGSRSQYFVAKIETSPAPALGQPPAPGSQADWKWVKSSHALRYAVWCSSENNCFDETNNKWTRLNRHTELGEKLFVEVRGVEASEQVYVAGSFRGALAPSGSSPDAEAAVHDRDWKITQPQVDTAVFSSGCHYWRGGGLQITDQSCRFNVFVERYSTDGDPRWLRQGGSSGFCASVEPQDGTLGCQSCQGGDNDGQFCNVVGPSNTAECGGEPCTRVFQASDEQSDQIAMGLAVNEAGEAYLLGAGGGLDSGSFGARATLGAFRLEGGTKAQLLEHELFVAKLVDPSTASDPKDPVWRWVAGIQGRRTSEYALDTDDPKIAVHRSGSLDQIFVAGATSAGAGSDPQLALVDSALLEDGTRSVRPAQSRGGPWLALLEDSGASATWDSIVSLDYSANWCSAGAPALPPGDLLTLGALDVSSDGDVFLGGAVGGRLVGSASAGHPFGTAGLCAEPGVAFQATTFDRVTAPNAPPELASGDMDGDGDTDIVIGQASSVIVLRNDGVGGFSAGSSVTLATTGRTPAITDLDVGDLDGDGDLDIAVADSFDSGTRSMLWAIQNQSGMLSGPYGLISTNDVRRTITSVDTGDVENDGDDDITVGRLDSNDYVLVYDTSAANLDVFDGQVTGQLDQGPNVDFLVRGFCDACRVVDTEISDVDGNGLQDIVIYYVHDNALGDKQILIDLRRENGTQLDRLEQFYNFGCGASYDQTNRQPLSRLEIADLDDDGDRDFIVLDQWERRVDWLENVSLASADGSPRLLSGTRDAGNVCPGTTGRTTRLPIVSATASALDDVTTADFDGDGDVDVAVLRAGLLELYGNRGSGVFERLDATSGASNNELIAADLTGDRMPDVLAATSTSQALLRNAWRTDAFVLQARGDVQGALGDFIWGETASSAPDSVGLATAAVTGLSTDAQGGVRVGGTFAGDVQFENDDGLDRGIASGGPGASFLSTLDRAGNWPRFKTWVMGEKLMPPNGAALTMQPEVEVSGVPNAVEALRFFYWNHTERALYAVRPTCEDASPLCKPLDDPDGNPFTIRVKWPLASAPGSADRIVETGGIAPSANAQPHILNAPIDLAGARLPNDTQLTLVRALYSDTNPGTPGAVLDGSLFSASEGFSVLLFVEGTTQNDVVNPAHLLLVETRPAQSGGDPLACTIGQEILPPGGVTHDDPGRNGFVIQATAPIDGTLDGSDTDAPYDRSTREGQIIAVNEGAFDVAWYESGLFGLRWPGDASRHSCTWPTDAPHLVVASLLGSDAAVAAQGTIPRPVVDTIPVTAYPGGHIYRQNDPAKLGYNPNDEHAFLAAPNCAQFPSGGDDVVIAVDVSGAPASITVQATSAMPPATLLEAASSQLGITLVGFATEDNSFSRPVDAGGLEVLDETGQPRRTLESWWMNPLGGGFTARDLNFYSGFEFSLSFVGDEPALVGSATLNAAIAGLPAPGASGLVVVGNPDVGTEIGRWEVLGGQERPSGCDPLDPDATLYALRVQPVQTASKPFVLLKWLDDRNDEDSSNDLWKYKVYGVLAENGPSPAFQRPGIAGQEIFPPYPLTEVDACGVNDVPEATCLASPTGTCATDGKAQLYIDHREQTWARAAGSLSMRWFYGLDAGKNFAGAAAGTCLPFLDEEFEYSIEWPKDAPKLRVGETLTETKRGLPDVITQSSVAVIFPEPGQPEPAKLYAPLVERTVDLPDLLESDEFGTEPESNVQLRYRDSDGYYEFLGLPAELRERVFYDEDEDKLGFRGTSDRDTGDEFLLPNVMSAQDVADLEALTTDLDFRSAVNALREVTRKPDGPESLFTRSARSEGYALTAAEAESTGYVTLAFGDLGKCETTKTACQSDAECSSSEQCEDDDGLPVTLEVIEVACDTGIPGPYQGQIELLPQSNVFDERFTMRHNGDFAGNTDGLEFEWYIQPDVAGLPPAVPTGCDEAGCNGGNLRGWEPLSTEPGAVRYTLTGDDPRRSLVDNWFVTRWRYAADDPRAEVCRQWSPFAGSPDGTRPQPEAQLAEGWVKRVTTNIDPFEQRVGNFHDDDKPTETYSSLLRNAGERFEGPIAFNPSASNVEDLGLIEVYESVLRRARRLTIDAAEPVRDLPAANNALLFAAGRIADLYLLLGNEAYADASDPTIGITTASGEPLSAPPSAIFAFEGQVDSLLREELILLRGREDAGSRPRYNRIGPNFTNSISDGQLAYVNNYGVETVEAARKEFPQGHGDAWGHYLTAIRKYYDLLRDPDYDWEPRAESVSVDGTPTAVDFFDERKFARAAAARARTGAEIVDLTYRDLYEENPSHQWKGYKDNVPAEAWGLSEWGRRAGRGAYYDWVVANSLVPDSDPDPDHESIQKIDRSTVPEISEIAAAYQTVQEQLDEADRGLNPLGLAKGVVPFDIDPSLIDAGMTHFEQVFESAKKSLRNAVEVFDYANELTNRLRKERLTQEEFAEDVEAREKEYEKRLKEVFGTPYPEDTTYPDGYTGPDIYHYMVVDRNELVGQTESSGTIAIKSRFQEYDLGDLADLGGATCRVKDDNGICTVQYSLSADGSAVVKDPSWESDRPVPGEIQERLSDVLVAGGAHRQAAIAYDAKIQEIVAKAERVGDANQLLVKQLAILRESQGQLLALDNVIAISQSFSTIQKDFADKARKAGRISAECLPRMAMITGTAVSPGDVNAPLGCSLIKAGELAAEPFDDLAGYADDAIWTAERAKAAVTVSEQIQLKEAEVEIGSVPETFELEKLIREEPALFLEVEKKAQHVRSAQDKYRAALAKGVGLLAERETFRQSAADDTREARYRDLSFRVFRNQAIEKYRAAFALAARYAYLAVTAFDYETNSLGVYGPQGTSHPLRDIVKETSLGALSSTGQPLTTSDGLAGVLARVSQSFDGLEGQLGFNNPVKQKKRFSLRRELFRVRDAAASDRAWCEVLSESRVDNLWEIPEFRRHAKPFSDERRDGPQPAIVIPFSTTIQSAMNFFGHEAALNDARYSPSLFATKVRAVGVWFKNSPSTVEIPVYLLPVGVDVLRSPKQVLETREWAVVDQVIPPPPPNDGFRSDDWFPSESLWTNLPIVRRIPAFDAYPLANEGEPPASEFTSSSRLVGRSVWNSQWLLIIPGNSVNGSNPERGLDQFIDGETPDASLCESPEGVKDIQLLFNTYSAGGL